MSDSQQHENKPRESSISRTQQRVESAPMTRRYAKTRIVHGTVKMEGGKPVLGLDGMPVVEHLVIEPGAEIPAGFDPGTEGLTEGIHWERGR